MKNLLLPFLLMASLSSITAQEKMKFNLVAEIKPFINFDNPDVHKEAAYQYNFNPVKSGAGIALGIGLQGVKNRFIWGLSAGWQRNQTTFEMQHPEITSLEYKNDVTSNLFYFKAGGGVVVKKFATGAHLDLLFSAGLLYKTLYNTEGTEVLYEPYILEGETFQSPVFYVHYDFKRKNGITPIVYTFSFGPNYQTKTLFGRSALRIGLEWSSILDGRTDEANFVMFRGNGDRSIIANSKFKDNFYTLGLKIGLTF